MNKNRLQTLYGVLNRGALQLKRYTTIVVALFLCVFALQAQQIDMSGKKFWFSFAQNYDGNPVNSSNQPIIHDIRIRIVGKQGTQGILTINHTGKQYTFTIPSDGVFNFTTDATDANNKHLTDDDIRDLYNNYDPTTATSNTSNKAAIIEITQGDPVMVYAWNNNNPSYARTDVTNVLPIDVLGNEYIHIGRKSAPTLPTAFNMAYYLDQYMVVATKDNTIISEKVGNGTTVQVATLNKGQVYIKWNSDDMSGYKITSTEPVAYFTCHSKCLLDNANNISGDSQRDGSNFFQQLMPTNRWGKNFFVPVTKLCYERVRIIASKANTVVTRIGGGAVKDGNGNSGTGNTIILNNVGSWVEIEVATKNHPTHGTNGMYLSANEPIQVCTYMIGASHPMSLTTLGVNTYKYGGEALCRIPPVDQTVKKAFISPYCTLHFSGGSNGRHCAIIIAKKSAQSKIKYSINGAPQGNLVGQWYDHDNSEYSYCIMDLADSEGVVYEFETTDKDGIIVLGQGYAIRSGYYYAAYSGAHELTAYFTVNGDNIAKSNGFTYCAGLFEIQAVFDDPTKVRNVEWFIDNKPVNQAELGAAANAPYTDPWTIDLPEKGNDYEVKMRVTDTQGRTKDYTSTFKTQLANSPTVTISPPATPVCNSSVTLTANTTQGGTVFEYIWLKKSPSDATFNVVSSSTSSNTYTYNPDHGDVIKCIYVTNTDPCGGLVMVISDSRTINVSCITANDTNVATPRSTQLAVDLSKCTQVSNCPTPPTYSVKLQPTHGTATIAAGSNLIYTPNTTYTGTDQITYEVEDCNGMKKTARVNIFVYNPVSMKYVACSGAEVTVGFAKQTGVKYHWYDTETTQNKRSEGDSIKITKNNNGTEHFWVSVELNGTLLQIPRIHIEIEQGTNCGSTIPAECSKDGTMLWFEDFESYEDGLDPNSPVYSSTALRAPQNIWPGFMTTYVFANNDAGNTGTSNSILNEGRYALTKHGISANQSDPLDWPRLWFTNDHTTSDPATGRMFLVNGRERVDTLYRQTIDNVCDNMKLYFAFWVRGCDARLRWNIHSSNDNRVLKTFILPKLMHKNQWRQDYNKDVAAWKQFGFEFDVPPGVTSIWFELYDDEILKDGNDFAIDDISVHLCSNPVTASIQSTNSLSTTVCLNSPQQIVLEASYTDNNTLTNNNTKLKWCWLVNDDGSRLNDPTAWQPVTGWQIEAAGVKSLNEQLIVTTSTANRRYYRFAVTNEYYPNYNCYAMSDIITVTSKSCFIKINPHIRYK